MPTPEQARQWLDRWDRQQSHDVGHAGEPLLAVGQEEVADHVDLLRAAGVAEAGTVWQYGDDRVLVAVRRPRAGMLAG